MKHEVLREYESYEKAVYPQGVHVAQSAECEQAFVMGGFVCLNLLIKKLDENPESVETYADNLYRFFSEYKDSKLKGLMKANTKGFH